jgi:hypothetical protein
MATRRIPDPKIGGSIPSEVILFYCFARLRSRPVDVMSEHRHEETMQAVLAERLRRTLKARVRKSVGSIPTDCKLFFVFVFRAALAGIERGSQPRDRQTSGYSSVGRAGDCRWQQLISLGHWFDSGCPDLFFFCATAGGRNKKRQMG